MAICSLTRFRKITGNYDSFDVDILEALGYAQKLFEQKTERFFEYRDEAGVPIVRTERLWVYPDGLIYPKATPVRSCTLPTGSTLTGVGVSVARWPSAVVGYPNAPSWARAVVTFEGTGGFEVAEMPEDVIVAVATIASLYLPSLIQALSKIPAGATTIHVGDVSLSGKQLKGSSGSLSLPSDVKDTIRLWKRRIV